ncbi:hypothetical protein AVP41_01496 [Microbacterium sp. TNHR37B]|nr:hypothetical protein AVP41_01496 [Microbacterium sp. TNHR37B]
MGAPGTINRRSLLTTAAVGSLAALSTTALAGCAAPAVAPVLTGASGIGATWLADMTAALAAGAIVAAVSDPLKDAWQKWEKGRQRAYAEEGERGHQYVTQACYGDSVPPAMMFASCQAKEADVSSDRFIVCVKGGEEYVGFDPWAWQALYLFIDDLTKGKEGDTLAGFRALCKISLIPSATISSSSVTESGRSQLLSYKTRNGEVEMNRRTNSDGSTTVQVVSTGIPSASSVTTTREVNLS